MSLGILIGKQQETGVGNWHLYKRKMCCQLVIRPHPDCQRPLRRAGFEARKQVCIASSLGEAVPSQGEPPKEARDL